MTVPVPSETTHLLNSSEPQNLERSISKSSRNAYGTVERGETDLLSKASDFDTTWTAESKLLARYSAPLIVTYLLQYSYSLVTVYVAGRLGTKELGAASLASMTANITGLCVYEGLAMSLDTLTSQAYGAGRKKLVGIHVSRMCALMMVVTIPIGIVWMCSPWILARMVPEVELAELAGTYMRYYLIGAPGYGLFEAGKRFTQAQGNFTASLAVVLICAPLNILWNWLFVFRLGLGFRGAALAIAASNTLQPVVLVIYINIFARSTLECWPGLEIKKCFQNWGQMIKLGVPGILMVLSEWLAFDILTFTSSYISTEALAAMSVTMTIAVTMYHIPSPCAVAATTRFGNLIGHGALTAARKACVLYYVIFVCIGAFDIVVLTSLRYVLANIFTDDDVVRDIIIATLPVVAVAQMADALACIANGLLRGLGRQKVGGYVNLGVYYVWAIPLSLLLTFGPPNLGLLGLWIGPLSGLGIVTVVVTIYIKLSDWQKAVDEARARDE